MGKAKKRLNPKLKNKVNRRIKELVIAQIWDTISNLPDPWKDKTRGRKPYPAKQMAVICIYKESFGLTFEDMESELRVTPAITKILGMNNKPSHSSIHRASEKLTEQYIKLVNDYLVKKCEAKKIVVDSTGFSLRNSSTWYDIRVGKIERKEFLKLHISENVDNGLLMNYSITKGRAHDSPQFNRLLQGIDELDMVAGDSGYLSMKNCKIVEDKGGKPFFLPKKNTTAWARHPKPWKRMIRWFFSSTEEWLNTYHVRSVVEGLFSSVKKRFGSFLRALKEDMQRKELALKVIAYNVRQVLFIEVGKYLHLPLWIYTQ